VHTPEPRTADTTLGPVALGALADTHLDAARAASSGRSAHTVVGGHGARLRQSLLALAAGQGLAEHDSPGEATLHVLRGRVELRSPAGAVGAAAGDLLVVPAERHDLLAVEDSVVLLTVAVRGT
jgi:quercetin dioxygenase-like cupin family protein